MTLASYHRWLCARIVKPLISLVGCDSIEGADKSVHTNNSDSLAATVVVLTSQLNARDSTVQTRKHIRNVLDLSSTSIELQMDGKTRSVQALSIYCIRYEGTTEILAVNFVVETWTKPAFFCPSPLTRSWGWLVPKNVYLDKNIRESLISIRLSATVDLRNADLICRNQIVGQQMRPIA